MNDRLVHAAESNNAELIKELLKMGAAPNSKDEKELTALMASAFFGNADCVKLLLEWNADIGIQSNEGRTALIFATQESFAESLLFGRWMRNSSLRARYKDATDLISAAQKNSSEVARLLLLCSWRGRKC